MTTKKTTPPKEEVIDMEQFWKEQKAGDEDLQNIIATKQTLTEHVLKGL